ncbi:hypothetical protein TI05_08145 [Achromatium sp. WMS3]|nr:hypothetical protein TI05_08145 [Achromatium sp. WMS3]
MDATKKLSKNFGSGLNVSNITLWITISTDQKSLLFGLLPIKEIPSLKVAKQAYFAFWSGTAKGIG